MNEEQPTRIPRRGAIRVWLSRAAPLLLLAACGGPTASTPTAKPASAAPGQAPATASPPIGTASTATSPAVKPAVAASSSPAAAVAQAGSSQAAVPSCVLTPEQTIGPYFVDERLNRSDIRSDPSDGTVKDGLPLRLVLQVSQVSGSTCAPLAGAQVDLWQCDALGVYSDVRDPGFTTTGKKFLRGYQLTDQNGSVQFTTIYPGWYQGRTVHIHFRVRTAPDSQAGRELVSQLYFDDAMTDQVHAQPPYAQKGQRTLRNNGDGIFRQGGSQLIVPVVQDGPGYSGTFSIGLRMS